MSTEQQLVADVELVKRTLRTMGILVAALVVFVGALSLIAVAVTSKAVGGSKADNSEVPTAAKKPLSI
jgi:hypothetical protein